MTRYGKLLGAIIAAAAIFLIAAGAISLRESFGSAQTCIITQDDVITSADTLHM